MYCLRCDGVPRPYLLALQTVEANFKETFGDRPKAKDPLQARFGWPMGTPNATDHDAPVVKWMVTVATEVWNQRYGNQQRKKIIECAMVKRSKQTWEQQESDAGLEAQDAEDERLVPRLKRR